MALSTAVQYMQEVSPLCARIKNAFTIEEIELIHSTYNYGIQPVIDINPNSKLRAVFDETYVECEALGSFKIYNDEKKYKDENDKEDLVQIKICESNYSIKQQIANIECFVPITRIDQDDLRQNHRKILCKTEHRNFGNILGAKVNGHMVTYLDPIFTRYAKNVYDKMMYFCQYVDKTMEWQLLNDGSFRTKCIEYIRYIGNGANLGWHYDLGSLVTIVIMLSPSNQYEGGNLQVKKLEKISNEYMEKETQDVVLERGDIAVFTSSKCNHRVSNILNGKRCVLVMELIFW